MAANRATSLKSLKGNIKKRIPKNCYRRLRNTYIQRVGFVWQ